MPNLSLPVLDFHVHFVTPSSSGRAAAGAEDSLSYAQRQYRWMLDAWGFPEPEPTPEPDEVLGRWLGEIERYGLSGVVFVTGPGAPFLAEAQRRYPDKIYAFSHVSPDDPDAVGKLRRELDEYGLKG